MLHRIETVNGKRTFTFKDRTVGLYIDAGAVPALVGDGQAPVTGYHSIVQALAWPSLQDKGPLTMPAQINQHPRLPWFQEDLLAHSLLHRQMLQPAIKAAQLQVTRKTLAILAPTDLHRVYVQDWRCLGVQRQCTHRHWKCHTFLNYTRKKIQTVWWEVVVHLHSLAVIKLTHAFAIMCVCRG